MSDIIREPEEALSRIIVLFVILGLHEYTGSMMEPNSVRSATDGSPSLVPRYALGPRCCHVEAMPKRQEQFEKNSGENGEIKESDIRTMKSSILLTLVVSSTNAFCGMNKARFGVSQSVTLSAHKNVFDHVLMKGIVTGVTAISLATGVVGPLPILPVHAAESRLIGEIQGSGLIFKVRH